MRTFTLALPYLIIAASLSLAGMAAYTAPEGEPSSQAVLQIAPELRNDPRLQQLLSVAEADRPVGELLQELSGKLNVRLRARRETADDKVSLFLAERPAAEALSRLARQMDFQWYRTANGYELGQSTAAVRREAALRDREWAAVEAWMQHLQQLAKTPAPQLGARQREVEAALAQPGLAPEAARGLLEEQAALKDVLRHSKVVPVALQIYGTLTPLQKRQLRSYGSLRLASAFGGISPQLMGAAARGIDQPYLKPETPVWVDLVLRMTDASRDYYEGGARVSRRLRMDAFLTVAAQDSTAMVNMSPRSLVRVPLPEVGPQPPAGPGDPELAKEVTLTFPGARKLDGRPEVVLDRLREWNGDTLPLSGVARQVHEATGLDVVADSFVRARLRPSEAGAKMTVRALLDRVADTLGYAWWKEGKTLHLRSRSYHNDRPAEVPERVLRPWRERVRALPCPTMDELGELAVRLSEPQARGIHDYWGWYFGEAGIPSPSFSGGFYRLRHDLRFWGSLSRRQKAWAAAGNPLSVEAMDFRQRMLFLLAWTEPVDGDWGPELIRSVPPRPLVPTGASVPRSAVFRLTRREVELKVMTDEKGQHVTEITTVGSDFRPRGFRGGGPVYTPVGDPSLGTDFSLTYQWSPEQSGRSNHLYVFGP